MGAVGFVLPNIIYSFFGCSQRKMIAYVLNKDISQERLILDINKLLSKYNLNEKTYVLIVKVEPIESSNDSLIPKLEYKS